LIRLFVVYQANFSLFFSVVKGEFCEWAYLMVEWRVSGAG